MTACVESRDQPTTGYQDTLSQFRAHVFGVTGSPPGVERAMDVMAAAAGRAICRARGGSGFHHRAPARPGGRLHSVRDYCVSDGNHERAVPHFDVLGLAIMDVAQTPGVPTLEQDAATAEAVGNTCAGADAVIE